MPRLAIRDVDKRAMRPLVLLLLVFPWCSSVPAAPGDGLVAHYGLVEGEGGVVHDASEVEQNGTIHGAVWVASGERAALQFDGRTAYVACGSGRRLQLAKGIAVAAWIQPKADALRPAMVVGEGPHRWAIRHYRGKIYFFCAGGGNSCSASVPFYEWSHVGGTFDGSQVKLYVNGALRQTRDIPGGAQIISGSDVFVGGKGEKSDFYSGLIRDVRVYNRALAEAELMALASAGLDQGTSLNVQPAERSSATHFFRQVRAEPVTVKTRGRQMWLANRHLGIEIIKASDCFYLSRLYGVARGHDFLSNAACMTKALLWSISLRRQGGRDRTAISVGSATSARVSSRTRTEDSRATLLLCWDGLKVADEAQALDVEVSITLDANEPRSRWRISVTNRSNTYGLWDVVFPVLKLGPIDPDPGSNFLTVPGRRGVLVADPLRRLRRGRGRYPYHERNMQFQALYGRSGTGLYVAVHDGAGHEKSFGFTPYPAIGTIEYRASHYPRNMGFPAEDYEMAYDVCVSPFQGDWYDACQIYREWALEQRWCSKGPLAARRDIRRWYKEAPLVMRTCSYSRDALAVRTRDRILNYLQFLGGELPIVWYGWKQDFPHMTQYNREGSHWRVPTARDIPCGNIHEGNYPYIPALPSFAQACKAIGEAGGHVKAYIGSSMYDPGLSENAPLAAEAKPNAIYDLNGDVQHVHPSEKVTWSMCYHTKWWQERLRETVTALFKNENVGGVYFDTFFGGGEYHRCFSTDHGHSHGGGNDRYLGARKIAGVVRGTMKGLDPEAVISGEQPAETGIDLLDGFHVTTLEPNTIPLLATVYGDYIVRGGSHLNPRDGVRCYLQAATMFVEGAQMGRLPVHGRYHLEESPEEMAFLRKLSRYWRRGIGCRFLAYGRLLRPICFTEPAPMPTGDFGRSIRDREPLRMPVLQAGLFEAANGDLGAFVINVSKRTLEFRFELTPPRYPLRQSRLYSVARVDHSGAREPFGTRGRGRIVCRGEIGSHDVIFLEIRPTDG